MFKRVLSFIASVVLTLGFAQQAWAVQIVPPGNDVAGQSQLFWAQSWFQWAFGIPAPINPLNDTTGQYGGVNNNGPVFFVAGNFGGVSTRTITVPVGKPVFFPVLNSFYAPIGGDGNYDPTPCASPLTLACALQQVTPSMNSASNMAVQIDGITLDNSQIQQFRQTSTSYFTVELPQDNVFGVPAFPCCANQFWVQDGYWIALDDLSAGTHVLHFQGDIPGSSLDITTTLNVSVPEPATWAMMLTGFAGLGFAAYRSSRKNAALA